MAFRFPFSNLHELNLDWILSKVKDLSERVDNLDTEITDEIPQMQTDIETLQTEMPDKVNKTGDTLSGSLNYDGVYAILKSNNITDGVLPAVDTYGNSAVLFRDHDNNNLGRVSPYVTDDGDQSVMLLSQRKINNNNFFNYLRVGIDSSGHSVIDIPDVNSWLNALGLGDPTIITNVNDVVTASSGFTVNSVTFAKWGRMANLLIAITSENEVSTATNMSMAVLKSGYRPTSARAVMLGASSTIGFGAITPSGTLIANGTWVANTEKTFVATYILA